MKKTVLIIGGTSGIGYATAKRFQNDHNIIVIGKNFEKGSNVEKEIGCKFIQTDIRNPSDKSSLYDSLSGINITKIVHCAGVFSEQSSDSYHEEYRLVKEGGIEIVRKLIETNDITHICATSSLFTFLPSFAPQFEYSIQKQLETSILNVGDSIICNCVAPGLTNTRLAKDAYGNEGIGKILSLSPGSRIVEPEEIAETIYWLMNQFTINKSVIPIDGGFLQNYNL